MTFHRMKSQAKKRASFNLTNFLNPTNVIGLHLDSVMDYIRAKYKKDPGSVHFKSARDSALELLRMARNLNDLSFWKAIKVHPAFVPERPKETPTEIRAKHINRAILLLEDEGCIAKYFPIAVAVFRMAVTGMYFEFQVSLVSDRGLTQKEWMEAYKCGCTVVLTREFLSPDSPMRLRRRRTSTNKTAGKFWALLGFRFPFRNNR